MSCNETQQGVLLTVRLTGGKPWGFTAKEIFKDDDMMEVLLIISKVDPTGRSAGIVGTNDILLAIDGTPCRTVIDARNQIQSASSETLALTVWRKVQSDHRSSSRVSARDQSTPVNLPQAQHPQLTETETHATAASERDSPENPTDTDVQSNSDRIIASSEEESEESSDDDDEEEESSSACAVSDSQLDTGEAGSAMEAAPEATYSRAHLLQQQTPAAGQRGSLSSLRAASHLSHPSRDDSSSSHSDLIMNHRRPRASIDAYPQCGLPSGTLFRKSTSSASLRSPTATMTTPLDMPYMRPLSGAMLPGAPSVFRPIRNSMSSVMPEDFVEVYRTTSTTRSEFSGTSPPSYLSGPVGKQTSPTNPIASLSATALGAKSQKMMDLLNSHTGFSKNIYHATPAGQWSQTESSTAIYRDPASDSAHDRQAKKTFPKSQSVDMTLSATFRGAPAASSRVDSYAPHYTGSDSSRPGSDRFPENCCEFKQHGAKEAAIARTPLAQIPVNKQTDKRKPAVPAFSKPVAGQAKGANSAPGVVYHKGEHSAAAAASPGNGVKLTEVGLEFREGRRMPALRPNHFVVPPDDAGKNNHLTTVKEVRTYHIRPSLQQQSTDKELRASDSTSAGSPVSVRSSSSSTTPDDVGRRTTSHTRDASLDSHVSWQSSSTNSSGYSSVALSSSTPMLDEAVSEETLVPAEYMRFQEKDEMRDSPMSRSTSKNSVNSLVPESDTPHRSISVSEMIRNFGATTTATTVKTPPQPPPKPRYSHLPAHRPDGSQSAPKVVQFYERSRGNSIPTTASFASMEDISQPFPGAPPYARRASQATVHPVHVEERKEVIQKQCSPGMSATRRSHQFVQPQSPSPSPSPSTVKPVSSPAAASTGKPIPMFRTAVNGLVLGAGASKADLTKHKDADSDVLEELAPVAAQTASSIEDRGYGSGEIHLPSEALSILRINESTAAAAPAAAAGHLDSKMDSRVPEDSALMDSAVNREDLQHAKDNLTARLSDRIALLKEEQENIQQDVLANEDLGEDILEEVFKVASAQDVTRFKAHLKELEEITSLTMSLTSRLGKINGDLAKFHAPADELELSTLAAKKRKLENQYEDAVYLQKGIERRRQSMRSFLSQCLSVKHFEEYEDFLSTKMTLLRDTRNLDDKIRLGEEQLRCLRNSGSY